MRKNISKKLQNKLLALILIVALLVTSSFSVYATSSADKIAQPYQVETFSVVSKNTVTGEVTTQEYDTSITTAQLNEGINVVSTPSYAGQLPASNDVEIADNNITPRYIVGFDDRERILNPSSSVPYRAICRIESYWDLDNNGVIDNVVKVGTGFLIGPSAVVTAGHCIYDVENNKWCKYAEVTFAQNGPDSAPYGIIRSTTIHTSSAWVQNGDWNQDWAVVEIQEEIGNTLGWFGKMWTNDSLNNTQITVTGYPGDLATDITDKFFNDIPNKGTYMWTCDGAITTSYSARLEYSADTFGGMSGGPVYNSSNQILAINTYETINVVNGVNVKINGGTRISEWLYNYLEQYRP